MSHPRRCRETKGCKSAEWKVCEGDAKKRGYNKKEKTYALRIFDVVILESDLPHELKEAINAEGVLLYEKLKLR